MPSTSQPNALLTAAHWIEALLTGPFAVSVAAIAVAGARFMMLSGRLNVRHGAIVLIGCFIRCTGNRARLHEPGPASNFNSSRRAARTSPPRVTAAFSRRARFTLGRRSPCGAAFRK